MGLFKKNNATSVGNDNYDEDDFAIGFHFDNGKLKKKSEFLSHDILSKFDGITNATDDKPDDILKMAIYCDKCGAFMKYVPSDEWMGGTYVCDICKASVGEADPITQLNDNMHHIFDGWDDQ